MYWIIACAAIIVGYLSGSLSSAIIISRIVNGKEIRDIGNKNPGTMNVARNVGTGWGVAVGLLDAAKAFMPMLIARRFFFPGPDPLDFLIVIAVGIAAIIGHRKPIFHKFIGGGSVACAIGCYFFAALWEFVAAFIVSSLISILFMKNVKYRFGRWTPIIAIVLSPFVALLFNAFINVPMFAGTSLGGHPWEVLVGAFMISITMLFLNLGFLLYQAKEKGQGESTHE